MTAPYLTLAALLLRQVEGCILHPYQDSVGVWTIGIGCTRLNGLPVSARTPSITMDQAVAACEFELGRSDAVVARYAHVPLTDGERAALISFVYNVGTGGFVMAGGRPTGILSKLNAGDYAGAAAEFPKWNMAGGRVSRGLVSRRALERSVFEGKAVLLAGAKAAEPTSIVPKTTVNIAMTAGAKPPPPPPDRAVIPAILAPHELTAAELNDQVWAALHA